MQETQEIQFPFLGWEDPLEEEMATHSNSCLKNPMDRGADEEMKYGHLALWFLHENSSWRCLDLQHHFCSTLKPAIRRLKELKDQ